MVVADGTAAPNAIALDLCAQAEHGEDSPLALISPDAALLDRVAELVTELAAARPSVADAPLALITAPGLERALGLADALAPEHLELAFDGADEASARSRVAGCVFVGSGGATAFGDYAAGSNHVLPTGGAARFGGPLGPGAFMRRSSVVSIGSAAARELAPHVAAIAAAEGFPVHGESATATGEAMSDRAARIERETRETKIALELELGGGEVAPSTGIGFFDHMLELLGRHGNLGLVVRATGDLETGAPPHGRGRRHRRSARHSMRRSAIGPASAVTATPLVPMDEALAECAIDVSGRPYCRFDAELPPVTIAGFEAELTEEFFRAVAANAKLTVHLGIRHGSNPTT